MYILFTPLHIVDQFHTKSAVFLQTKFKMITTVILILYKKLKVKNTFVLDTMLPFLLYFANKNHSKQPQHCFASLSNMTVFRS